MSTTPDTHNETPDPDRWPRLEQLNPHARDVLRDFVHGASENSHCRTVAVTTLVMGLWQLAGGKMTPRPPSLVLVNAAGHDRDPTDLLTSHLLAAQPRREPGTPEQNPHAMAGALRDNEKLGKCTPWNARIYKNLECRYFDAQRSCFEHGPSLRCSEATRDTLRRINGREDDLILRLEEGCDHFAFRQDVLAGGDMLKSPHNFIPKGMIEPKTVSVSGSIPARKWDLEFADAVVGLGEPMIFLPSLAKEPPEAGDLPVLEVLSMLLPKALDRPAEELDYMSPCSYHGSYYEELRGRLRHLPGDYEYCILKLARQISPVCIRIAGWSSERGLDEERDEELGEIDDTWRELCTHTLHGLVLSIAGLAWHVLGFDPGCPRTEALNVLNYLRKKGAMTKEDLLIGARLNKRVTDLLVERFAAEDLVRVDGKIITATSYPEFVAALYSREGLPLPVLLPRENPYEG